MLRRVLKGIRALCTVLERAGYMRTPVAVPASTHAFLLKRLRGAVEVVTAEPDVAIANAPGMAALARKPERWGLPTLPRSVRGRLGALARATWQRVCDSVSWLAQKVLPEVQRQLNAAERRPGNQATRVAAARDWVSQAGPSRTGGRLTHLFNTRPGVAFEVMESARLVEAEAPGQPGRLVFAGRTEAQARQGRCPLPPDAMGHALASVHEREGRNLTAEDMRILQEVLEPVFPDAGAAADDVAASLAAPAAGDMQRQAEQVELFQREAGLQTRQAVGGDVMQVLLTMPSAKLHKARGAGATTRQLVRLAHTMRRHQDRETAAREAAVGAEPAGGVAGAPLEQGEAPVPHEAASEADEVEAELEVDEASEAAASGEAVDGGPGAEVELADAAAQEAPEEDGVVEVDSDAAAVGPAEDAEAAQGAEEAAAGVPPHEDAVPADPEADTVGWGGEDADWESEDAGLEDGDGAEAGQDDEDGSEGSKQPEGGGPAGQELGGRRAARVRPLGWNGERMTGV